MLSTTKNIMIPIILADGVTKVWLSIEDVEDALKYSWHVNSHGYPRGFIGGRWVYLHRWVADRMGLALDEVIDHRDRNPLNASRKNLRYSNQQQNCFNQSIAKNNTSGYKGVSWYKQTLTWLATVCIDGKNKHLGYYDDPISAAVAYDKKAIELFGEYACTNLMLGYLTEEDYANAKPARVYQRKKASKIGFKGVKVNGKSFLAQISVQGKMIYLGTYSTPEEAARAFDKCVIENRLDRVTNASLGLL